MVFPPEIIEKILINCDGKTLINASYVSEQWNEIVRYITKKTAIWRKCCHEEIPKNELDQYLYSYYMRPNTNPNIWYYIYRNWVTWQNIQQISFEAVPSRAEIPKITCIDVFDNYIAVGSEDGRVRIFDNYWTPLHVMRIQIEKVVKVRFFYASNPNDISKTVLNVVISYPKQLIIAEMYSDGLDCLTLENVLDFSRYKDYIVYLDQNDRITVSQLNPNVNNNLHGRIMNEVWSKRVYSSEYITGIKMVEGVCTILTDNDVRQFEYTRKSPARILNQRDYCPTVLVEGFSTPPNSMPSEQKNFLLRNDLIIVLHKSNHSSHEQYMEVIILLGGPKFVRKLFNTTEVLNAHITCVCLYGNTFVLGVDTGVIYFYQVSSWKHFRIFDPHRKIIIGKHPITNICAKESKDKRTFFVTSSFSIHEVVGFCSPGVPGLD